MTDDARADSVAALSPHEAELASLARAPEALRHVVVTEQLTRIERLLTRLAHRFGVEAPE